MKLIDDGNSTFGYKLYIFYHVCICCSVMSKLCDPMDFHLPGSSVLNSPGKSAGVSCYFPGELPILGIESRSSALQANSLPPELPNYTYKLNANEHNTYTCWTSNALLCWWIWWFSVSCLYFSLFLSIIKHSIIRTNLF